MRSLFKQDVTGQIRVWEIQQISDSQVEIRWGVLDGVMQSQVENIPFGLSTRTQQEQVESRINSRINKQLDRGYKNSIEEAKELKGTNSLGLDKPMLAQPITKVKNIDYNNAFLQPKYDGHRCLVTKVDGEVIAYSRQGKLITSIPHILGELDLLEGTVLDGELYCHGHSLQAISSWIKKEQNNSLKLNYHVYDVLMDLPYIERYEYISQLTRNLTHTVLASTIIISTGEDVQPFFQSCISQGYEGAILRWGAAGYEVGKRSKSLVKIKEFHDDEFEVLDIEASKDNWAVLICLCRKGKFKVSAPGSIHNKIQILKNKNKYIGKFITVQYSQLTPDGLPFHPVALRWREDI